MWEDRLLVRRLRRGDRAALGRVYEKYKDDLLTIANCLVAERAAAEDCLHDVFVNLAGQAAEFRLNSNLKGYLITCVANRARDRLRAKRWQKDNASLENISEAARKANEPTAEIINSEESAKLGKALGQLPYEQREVITLHVHGKLRFREIAKRQGVSTNTVQSRYRYGLDKLRKLLNTGARP